MVATVQREKFATQVQGEILGRVRKVAVATNKPIQEVVESALSKFVDEAELQLQKAEERKIMIAAWEQSKIDNAKLYKRLAE